MHKGAFLSVESVAWACVDASLGFERWLEGEGEPSLYGKAPMIYKRIRDTFDKEKLSTKYLARSKRFTALATAGNVYGMELNAWLLPCPKRMCLALPAEVPGRLRGLPVCQQTWLEHPEHIERLCRRNAKFARMYPAHVAALEACRPDDGLFAEAIRIVGERNAIMKENREAAARERAKPKRVMFKRKR